MSRASCVEHVTRLDDALCPDWPQPVGAGGYRVVVTGTPSYQCDVQMTARPGQGDPGVIGTAGRLVNAIPAVCAAPPGLLSALDLPLVPGTGLMRPYRIRRTVTNLTVTNGVPVVRTGIRGRGGRRAAPRCIANGRVASATTRPDSGPAISASASTSSS